jgi:hypothetical protein
MRPTGTSATARGWQAAARKQGAAVVGLPCPSFLYADVVGGSLVQRIETRLEGARLGNGRDNQD